MTQLYSPINYVNKEIPNTLIIHGNKDKVVPLYQSMLLKEKLKLMDIPVQLHVLDGVDHAFMNATPHQKAQTQKWITDFVIDHYIE